GRQAHLAFEPLLFERLEMEARVLERDRRLVGEEAERAPVAGAEGPDPAAALLVAHRDQAARAALDLDRHAEEMARPRQQGIRSARLAGQEAGERRIACGERLRGLAAERPLHLVAPGSEQVE